MYSRQQHLSVNFSRGLFKDTNHELRSVLGSDPKNHFGSVRNRWKWGIWHRDINWSSLEKSRSILGRWKSNEFWNHVNMYQLRYQLQIFVAGNFGAILGKSQLFWTVLIPPSPANWPVCLWRKHEISPKRSNRNQRSPRDVALISGVFQPGKNMLHQLGGIPGPLAVEFVKVYRGPFIKINRLLVHC